ncbi:MATE family efflux transporter [Vibrio sp. SS-MA-C1-2]|uniref:MATE family efflux transporter n=1 Tax=Vibrio sp. SS-MA-C1-2 TaxID=2908646 RepID=UPI001F1FC6B3|nr:MATE family efflux transporter [Vibrio sp. SS-MA-C1-2]UJF18638.1 MATE family efflux transporter [Vibrio sp. SS-MA-C1-2]
MTNRDNQILTQPIIPLFFRFVIPAILGLLAISSASIVDGIFVGRYVGKLAIAGINLILPLGSLFFGIAAMFAIGGSVVVGKLIGQGERKEANNVFSRTMIAIIFISLFLGVLGLFFIKPLLAVLGANGELFDYAYRYLWLYFIFQPMLMVVVGLSYFIRVDGSPRYAAFIMILAAMVNIFLDWLFISLFGWGIEGAICATGASFFIGMLFGLFYFISTRSKLTFYLYQKQWLSVLKSAFNGFSEFINEASAGLTIFIFNWVMVLKFGSDGVAAFAIIGYFSFIGLLTSYAISEGLQPVIAMNLGAKQSIRIRYLLMMAVSCILLVSMMIIFLLIKAPDLFVNLFLREDAGDVMDITLRFVSYYWPAFIFNGINLLISGYLTAIHKPIPSAIIASSRSLVLPVAFLVILPWFMGDDGLFAAIFMAEAVTFIIAGYFYWQNRPQKLFTIDKNNS